jgi:hypothetical protein
MKKSNKEIRDYANHYIKKLGSVSEFNKEISKSISYLSEDGDAMSNVNQIHFLSRVLFYLRYEYHTLSLSKNKL